MRQLLSGDRTSRGGDGCDHARASRTGRRRSPLHCPRRYAPDVHSELIGPTPGAIANIGTGVGALFKRATQPFGPDIGDTLEAMAGGGLKNANQGRAAQD